MDGGVRADGQSVMPPSNRAQPRVRLLLIRALLGLTLGTVLLINALIWNDVRVAVAVTIAVLLAGYALFLFASAILRRRQPAAPPAMDYDTAIILDAEELAEGRIVAWYDEVRTALAPQDVQLRATSQRFAASSYTVIMGDREILVYDENNPVNTASTGPWRPTCFSMS